MVGDIYLEISFIPFVNPKRTQALLESNLPAIRFTDWNGQKALFMGAFSVCIPRVLWLKKTQNAKRS
jgi:hypothetical protein